MRNTPPFILQPLTYFSWSNVRAQTNTPRTQASKHHTSILSRFFPHSHAHAIERISHSRQRTNGRSFLLLRRPMPHNKRWKGKRRRPFASFPRSWPPRSASVWAPQNGGEGGEAPQTSCAHTNTQKERVSGRRRRRAGEETPPLSLSPLLPFYPTAGLSVTVPKSQLPLPSFLRSSVPLSKKRERDACAAPSSSFLCPPLSVPPPTPPPRPRPSLPLPPPPPSDLGLPPLSPSAKGVSAPPSSSLLYYFPLRRSRGGRESRDNERRRRRKDASIFSSSRVGANSGVPRFL